MIKTFHIIVSGRVQGVGFRCYTRDTARRMALTGTVTNLADGNVEIFVTGSDEQLTSFCALVKKGPSHGLVRHIEIVDVFPVRSYPDFSIILDRSW